MAFSLKGKAVKFTSIIALLLSFAVFVINAVIVTSGRENIVQAGSFTGAHTAIVPGAYVSPDGRLCDMLADRVSTAVDLYKQGKVEKLLMTGDHGRSSYDEVNSMRKYAEAGGVPARDIFMDHAGFSTYDSMYRAREVFRVNSAVIVTQDFHLLINQNGRTIRERITPPAGFTRVEAADGSFGRYLRELPLKPPGSKVKYYNGSVKPGDVYEAVIDLDVGDRDLQQCADAVIRLRAEYLYGKGLYDRIHFNFTNGFKADYTTWMQGNRIVVEGNKAFWVKRAGYYNDYGNFRQYLDMVFAYAGTLSLSGEMKNVPLEDMKIGDVFLKGEDPGHCVIVVDMAENRTTGEKLFMLAQSYMPAQDIHILKNPRNEEISPWYPVAFGETLNTPEWSFNKKQLVRFQD